MTEYNVRLDAFEGPLDLLLHLINRYEIDIYDIPVAKITEQYMDYIHTMRDRTEVIAERNEQKHLREKRRAGQ